MEKLKFFENFLKSEISKKYDKILISELVLFDSALIYTYSVKFLLRTEASLKIGNIVYIHMLILYLKIYLSVCLYPNDSRTAEPICKKPVSK